MAKYTVRWTEQHTVGNVDADSEEEAIRNALQMADDSYHSSEGFTAILEDSDGHIGSLTCAWRTRFTAILEESDVD